MGCAFVSFPSAPPSAFSILLRCRQSLPAFGVSQPLLPASVDEAALPPSSTATRRQREEGGGGKGKVAVEMMALVCAHEDSGDGVLGKSNSGGQREQEDMSEGLGGGQCFLLKSRFSHPPNLIFSFCGRSSCSGWQQRQLFLFGWGWT